MEPLPVGANFKRAKMLWEIGLHIAGDPAIPYGGNRDMCIAVYWHSGHDAGRRSIPKRLARRSPLRSAASRHPTKADGGVVR